MIRRKPRTESKMIQKSSELKAIKRELDYTGFLMQVTSGLDGVKMSHKKIVEYMTKHDQMPNNVCLWEAVENDSPRQLVKNGLGYKPMVIIEVTGGVAEITQNPEDVQVIIIDHDDLQR